MSSAAQLGDIVLFHYRWARDGITMRTRPAIVIWTNGFLCDLHVFWGSDDGPKYEFTPIPVSTGTGMFTARLSAPPLPVVNGVTPGDETIDQSWSHRLGVGDPRDSLH